MYPFRCVLVVKTNIIIINKIKSVSYRNIVIAADFAKTFHLASHMSSLSILLLRNNRASYLQIILLNDAALDQVSLCDQQIEENNLFWIEHRKNKFTIKGHFFYCVLLLVGNRIRRRTFQLIISRQFFFSFSFFFFFLVSFFFFRLQILIQSRLPLRQETENKFVTLHFQRQDFFS